MPALEITTKVGCPNKCIYCPQEKFVKAYLKRSKQIMMSFATFKKCLNKLPKNVSIHFSGMSEPWSDPECTKMLLYAHEYGFKIIVFTTTVGMNLKDIEAIKDIPFCLFEVHLPDNKDKMSIKVEKNYLKIIKKLAESNIQNIRFRVYDGMIHPQIKKTLVKNIKEKNIHSRAGNLEIYKSKKLSGRIKCKKRLVCNVLLPNGDVILCCNDYGIRHTLGNLLYSDYNSLFKSKEFNKVKKELLDPKSDVICRYCVFAEKLNLAESFKIKIKSLIKNKNVN